MLAQSVNTKEFDLSISKGYDFYLKNFFDNDGTAKYYNNSTKPIDMHSFSQAIFTLLKIGGEEKDIELCKKVVNKSIDLLYLKTKEDSHIKKVALLEIVLIIPDGHNRGLIFISIF